MERLEGLRSIVRGTIFFCLLFGTVDRACGQVLERGLHYFALEDVSSGGFFRRGTAGNAGVAFRNIALGPNQRFRAWIVQADTLLIGFAEFRTPQAGRAFRIPQIVLGSSGTGDSDGDGAPDDVEKVLGTDPRDRDSDDDGIEDGAEIRQGLNPLDGRPARTGIFGSVDTPGNAVDVAAFNELVVVADADSGIMVFNVFNGMDPLIIGQLDTPGSARAVDIAGNLIVVADGVEGVSVVDVSAPPEVVLRSRTRFNASALSVATGSSVAFVGLENGDLVAMDIVGGAELGRRNLGSFPVEDVGLSEDAVYAFTNRQLYALALRDGELVELDSVRVRKTANPITGRVRLSVGGGLATAVGRRGPAVIDIADPTSLRLITEASTGALGWKAMVHTGSGIGFAAVGANATGPHNVGLYDVSVPENNNALLTEFGTPGTAQALTIFNGIGYIADGERGLQVFNFLAPDTGDEAPQVSLRVNAPGLQIEEGKTFRVTVDAVDDVQVRNVDLLVDGRSVGVDGNFPFEFRFPTPNRESQPNLTLVARASDTGGNFSDSVPVTITVLPDSTPPTVRRVIPSPGVFLEPFRTVTVFFSEPLDFSSVSENSFVLRSAGENRRFGDEDDLTVPSGVFRTQEAANSITMTLPETLPAGRYQAELTTALTDRGGNSLEEVFSWEFFSPEVGGVWDFDDGDLRATQGIDLAFLDGVGGPTSQASTFGTTSGLGIADINGESAGVFGFPAAASGSMGLLAEPRFAANGGGARVNQYTVVMDLYYPAASSGQSRGLFSTRSEGDAALFLNESNALGVDGQFFGEIPPDTWRRVAVAVDGASNRMDLFLDGVRVGGLDLDGVDGRWSLAPLDAADPFTRFFTDDDGESAPGFVNSLQIHDARLSDSIIAALGAADAGGIPINLPPRVLNVAPGPLGSTLVGEELIVLLNESARAESVSPNNVFAIDAGPDGRHQTDDDVIVRPDRVTLSGGGQTVVAAFDGGLPGGFYLGHVGRGVEDLEGSATSGVFEWPFFVGVGVTVDTIVETNDRQFDGQTLIVGDGVNPVTLTMDGNHDLDRLIVLDHATLNHSGTTPDQEFAMRLNVARSITVTRLGTIDASGRGYLGGRRNGNDFNEGRTLGNTIEGGSPDGAGGSHGGIGGEGTTGSAAMAYGSITDPNTLGSGGGARSSSQRGGNGGGILHLAAGTDLRIDGRVRADGGDVGAFFGAGGAGGSVRLEARRFLGVGSISATGGAPGTRTSTFIRASGAGGGRIAVHFDENLFAGTFDAAGSAAGSGDQDGGAGTLFLKRRDQSSGSLFIAGGGLDPANESTPLPENPQSFSSMDIRSGAKVSTLGAINVTTLEIEAARLDMGGNPGVLATTTARLRSGSVLSHRIPTSETASRLVVNVSGDFSVDATSAIDVSNRGYPGARRRGNASNLGMGSGLTTDSGSREMAGGSHGGRGGSSLSGAAGAAFGALAAPIDLGGGGGSLSSSQFGGNGGGAVKVSVGGLFDFQGALLANGGDSGNSFGGGGAGGSIWIDAGAISGAGVIRALGGAAGTRSGTGRTLGGGGGGRVAIHSSQSSFTGVVEAYGGIGGSDGPPGGAGTIFTKDSEADLGTLVADNNLRDAEVDSTPLPAEPASFLSLDFRRGAKPSVSALVSAPILRLDGGGFSSLSSAAFRADEIDLANGAYLNSVGPVIVGQLNVRSGSRLTHPPATAEAVHRLDVRVSGNMTLDATSEIDVSGQGFAGAQRRHNTTSTGQTEADAVNPGSGGVSGGSHGGLGGQGSTGNRADAFGSVTEPFLPGSGGGAFSSSQRGGNGGGVVKLTVDGTLQLDGVVRANGVDAGNFFGGGGGGGSVWIDTSTLTGGGSVFANGGDAGTRVSSSTLSGGGGGGRIAVRSGSSSFTGSLEAKGGVGRNGGANGGAGTIFQIDSDAASGVLLADNRQTPSPADTTPLPQSPTVFQRIDVRSGASVAADDVKVAQRYELDGGRFTSNGVDALNVPIVVLDNGAGLSLCGPLNVDSLTLGNGSTMDHVATTIAATHRLEVAATGNVSIDATSRIDVTGLGLPGAQRRDNASNTGGTIAGIGAGSTSDSGASHGGAGGRGTSGAVGATYGSLTEPFLPGSGGGSRSSSHRGGNGGGVVKLFVGGALALDGAIRADAAPTGGFFGGGGSGGSVWIDAGTFSGSGIVSSNGSAAGTRVFSSIGLGGGGAGRIAIHHGTSTFDGTLEAFGGTGTNDGPNGGAGTIFVRDKDEVDGSLRIANNNRPAPEESTPLPTDAPIDFVEVVLAEGASVATESALSAGPIELDGATLTVAGGQSIQAGNLTLENGSRITHFPSLVASLHAVNLRVTGNAVIDASSSVEVDHRGFPGGHRRDNPTNTGLAPEGIAGSSATSGGSHGGAGGSGHAGSPGPVFGSVLDPDTPGGGGGAENSSQFGGSGGGVIRFVIDGALTLDGRLSADGQAAGNVFGGGGAGGSVYVETGSLSGGGTIRANGGAAGSRVSTFRNQGGGGGGRIAVVSTQLDAFVGTVAAEGGPGSEGGQDGQNGSIHPPALAP